MALGLALTQHYRTQVFRREGLQLKGIIDRLAEILGTRSPITGNPPVYHGDDGRQIEFNSMPNLGDETNTKAGPKDLLWVIDEAANFRAASALRQGLGAGPPGPASARARC